jgi:hypothetical protein
MIGRTLIRRSSGASHVYTTRILAECSGDFMKDDDGANGSTALRALVISE